MTPPAPRRVRFPALRLLLGLQPREETPAKTPLWLIILRMILAGLIILALAHPLLNPTASLAGKGPLVLAVDNGWAAARHWDERRNALDDLIAEAEREGRNIVLLPTAPLPGAAAPQPPSLLRPNRCACRDQRTGTDAPGRSIATPHAWRGYRRSIRAARNWSGCRMASMTARRSSSAQGLQKLGAVARAER